MLRGSFKKVAVRGRGRRRGMRLYFAAPSHSLNSKEEVGGGGQNRRGKTYLAKGKITHLIEKTLTQQDGKKKKKKEAE